MSHDIDPLATCLHCGHARWQHQNVEAARVKYQYSSAVPRVEPKQCQKDDCDCRQYQGWTVNGEWEGKAE